MKQPKKKNRVLSWLACNDDDRWYPQLRLGLSGHPSKGQGQGGRAEQKQEGKGGKSNAAAAAVAELNIYRTGCLICMSSVI